MKKLMLVAALAAVSACTDTETATETDTAATEEVAATPEAANLAADGQPAPGTYRVTLADGTVFTEEVKPDGTYVQTDADGNVVETGRWEQKSPEQYCTIVDEQYRKESDTGEQKCNTEGIGADGVWTSTGSDGKTATVERVTA